MRTRHKSTRQVHPNQGEWQMVMWKKGYMILLTRHEAALVQVNHWYWSGQNNGKLLQLAICYEVFRLSRC